MLGGAVGGVWQQDDDDGLEITSTYWPTRPIMRAVSCACPVHVWIWSEANFSPNNMHDELSIELVLCTKVKLLSFTAIRLQPSPMRCTTSCMALYKTPSDIICRQNTN